MDALCDGGAKTVNAKIISEDIINGMRTASKSSRPKNPHDIELPPLPAKDAEPSLEHGCRADLEQRDDLI
jgi:hypothetical protein